MAFTIAKLVFDLLTAYMFLSVGCEMRNYKGGHRFVKAFYAKTPYQRFYTLLQRNIDVMKKGELTYIGYLGVLIFTLLVFIYMLFAVYQWMSGNLAIVTAGRTVWLRFGIYWGLLSMFIEGVDSLLNRIISY